MSLAAHRYLDMSAPDDQQRDRSTPRRDEEGKGDKSWQRGFANAWMVLGAAPSGLLIGYFIDRAHGTAPWWMLGLSLTFLAASLYQLVKDSWK
jgi:F0F1-type ATP synthase assembly protein I